MAGSDVDSIAHDQFCLALSRAVGIDESVVLIIEVRAHRYDADHHHRLAVAFKRESEQPRKLGVPVGHVPEEQLVDICALKLALADVCDCCRNLVGREMND